MVREVLECLSPRSGGVYVDATLGLGGHTRAILEAAAPSGRVIGFEWDAQAAAIARQRLGEFGERIQIIPESYAGLAGALDRIGQERVDGIIADLGVSSLQLDRHDRGFSFQAEAPLDMRMDQRLSVTAADILARASEEELADIFYHYGEERQARPIARMIVGQRKTAPLRTTLDLARLVEQAVPKRFHPRRIHPATRVFQALRIAVNRELDNLDRLLTDAPARLKPGGRFCLIAFHSLEDRMVKLRFKRDPRLAPAGRGPVVPGPEEVKDNPRARSARLRCAVRVADSHKR